MWEIKETKDFVKDFNKLPLDIKSRFEKQMLKVREDPYGIGKPLGNPNLRELKNEVFCVYYSIYQKEIIILFIGISKKNNQKRTINQLKDKEDLLNSKYIKEKIIKYGTNLLSMDSEIKALIEKRDKLIDEVAFDIFRLGRNEFRIGEKIGKNKTKNKRRTTISN